MKIIMLVAAVLLLGCSENISGPAGEPTASVLFIQEVSQGDSSYIGELLWTKCLDTDFNSYSLHRSTSPNICENPQNSEILAEYTQANTHSHIDSNMQYGTHYYYVVCTRNTQNLTSWSNEIEVITPSIIPKVENLQLASTSTGRTVVLTWTEIPEDIDGYSIYFMVDGVGEWVLLGESTITSFVHSAEVAGLYAVKAYKDSHYSENFSNEVSTMPMIFNATYFIYDLFDSEEQLSGFIFFNGSDYGITGPAPDENFIQDMYAFDDSKGDYDVSLYSGNRGQFGSGNQSYFQEPAPGVCGNCDPYGNWCGDSYPLYTGDSVVFVALPNQRGGFAYAKMYGLSISPDPNSNHGTEVSFSFEYQPYDLGLTLFTSNAN